MAKAKNCYEILGVSKRATEKEIKVAYRALAKKYHPDVSEFPDAEERFVEASEAYDTLSDSTKRKRYDSALRNGGNATRASARYEAWQKQQSQASRARARTYARMNYQQYEEEYLYSSVFADKVPKALGCLLAFIVLLVLFIVVGLFLFFLFSSFWISIILIFAFLPTVAFVSTNIDFMHDRLTLKRRKARAKKRRGKS